MLKAALVPAVIKERTRKEALHAQLDSQLAVLEVTAMFDGCHEIRDSLRRVTLNQSIFSMSSLAPSYLSFQYCSEDLTSRSRDLIWVGFWCAVVSFSSHFRR